jgi:hypothetical protein
VLTPTSSEHELVEIIPPADAARWDPVVGEETLDLLDHLRLEKDSRERVLQEAVAVLARCLPPQEPYGQETGLAVGYVQSGKTMSFTTVAALARDNGYALVIVIAGTAVPLLAQSSQRLEADLRINSRDDRAWLHIGSDSIAKHSTRTSIRDVLDEWRNSDIPVEERRTVLITAMKHHGHLRKLTNALREIPLDGLPTLIIDDEADQASLNALVLKNKESTTYRRIKELRTVIPHHTFLQYTATPQAPLLINIIDTLSPHFAEVLTPGSDYVGGMHFFKEHKNLIKIIRDDELPTAVPDEAPESLLSAMRLFFIGVAAGLILDRGKGNRSMMIHPSQRTTGHSEYYQWAQDIRDTWKLLLDPQKADEDRDELLAEFLSAYTELDSTVPNLPRFPEIAKALHRAISKTVIEEINAKAGETPKIAWRQHYAWILVGGQAMDRGFTVEGLTVTYMPRSVGVGNADTVQQRARFFGYKRKYLGYCRVFLSRETLDFYEKYVEHEEDVRKRLVAHRDSGAPLTEWKRKFFLDEALKPTRKTVLEISYAHASGESMWHYTRMPHHSADAAKANEEVATAFLNSLTLEEELGPADRTEHMIHRSATRVPLRDVMENLLTKLHLTHPGDSSEFTLLQLMLSEHLERHPDANCVVYEMSRGMRRERGVNAKGEILNLFQGAAPSRPKGNVKVGDVYPGDRELGLRHSDPVVQIHRLMLKPPEGAAPGHVASEAVAIAVHIPEEYSPSILVQDQPAQGGS